MVLPQALAAVLPAIVNVFIAFFKATSIVVVVGIFDLMTAAKRAVADAQWQGFGTEIYLFVGGDLLRVLPRHVALQRLAADARRRGGSPRLNRITTSTAMTRTRRAPPRSCASAA